MDLLITYRNELLALAAILIVIFIYLKIKKDKLTNLQEMRNIEEELASKQTNKPSLEKIQITEDKKIQKEISKPVKEIQKEQNLPQKTFKKREVPIHKKISKENFQEFSGTRILLAEDNIINQKVILGLLAESGIEVVVANDGIEVLEILQNDNNFSLILMDAHMPRMDGFEATRKIRMNPDYNNIAVIALSGDTAADDIRKMTEAGMCEHLEKPLKIDAFYDILYSYSTSLSSSQDPKENTFIYNELNLDEGLAISGNDNDFYREILNEFINTYANAYLDISSYIKHGNLKDADTLLLDIIGVSANIGANKLHETATNLKISLNNSDNERSRILFHFKEELNNLLYEIKNYL